MATKKVEEEKEIKKKKATKSSVDKKKTTAKKIDKTEIKEETKKTTKKTVKKEKDNKKKVAKKEKKEKLEELVEKVETEKDFVKSEVSNNKAFFEDEEDDDYDDYDDEDEDDEDLYEERVVVKKKEKEVKEEKTSDKKKEEKVKEEKVKEVKIKKDSKKVNNKKAKSEKYIDKKVKLSEENEEIYSLIKIVVVIALIVGIVYLFVALLNGEFKKDETDDGNDSEVHEIQNEKILASSVFTKVDEEYYVLMYDGSSEWANYYGMFYSEYSYIEDAVPMFWVDLSDAFNKGVLVTGEEETNDDAQEYSELKVMIPTLIHIEDGKNVDYYEGEDVVKELKALIKSYEEE